MLNHSRETAVINYLVDHGEISSMDMITKFRITRPSDVIYNIRKTLKRTGAGKIVTQWVPFTSQYGGVKTRYAIYKYQAAESDTAD